MDKTGKQAALKQITIEDIKGKPYLKAEDIAYLLKIGIGKAYSIIRILNEELTQKGYICISGRVSKKYFYERFNIDKETGEI